MCNKTKSNQIKLLLFFYKYKISIELSMLNKETNLKKQSLFLLFFSYFLFLKILACIFVVIQN